MARPTLKTRWKTLRTNIGHRLLLVGLLQHLFVAVFLLDFGTYARVVWPINMLLLGALSGGLFTQQRRNLRGLKALLNLAVCVAPIWLIVVQPTPERMLALSVVYAVFFVVLFVEVLRYMARPGEINADLIVAALNGQLLLLETAIFTMQALSYLIPDGFSGLSNTTFTEHYLDLVYFCTIVLTSVGFGDIAPTHHVTRLAVSIFALASHVYSVLIVGVLIGRYTGAQD